jgi:transcriptional regulator with XRE-family HTH domain
LLHNAGTGVGIVIGTDLRVARTAQNIPLKRIATDLNLHPSYLSHVEHGRRTATPEIIAAYRKYISLDTTTSAAPTHHDAFVLALIEWFRSFDPYNRQTLLAFSPAHTVKENLLSEFAERLVNSTSLTKDDSVIMIWESATDYITISRWTWMSILQKILVAGARFKIFYAPAPNFEESEIFTLIQEYTRCLQFRHLVTFDSVADLHFSHFPVDFLYVTGKFALIRFAGRGYRSRNSLLIDANTFNDRTNQFDEPLRGYLERIESYRDQKIKTYFTSADLKNFFQDYAATEESSGHRYLFQSWPGSHDRPPEDYDSGSNWWKYYTDLQEQCGIDIQELARARKRGWDALRRRMKAFTVRHLCSRQVMEDWARTGKRPGFRPDISPEDRINQIENMITTLRAYPKCEMAMMDHQVGKALGWADIGADRNVSWLVQGNDKLIVEGHAADVDRKLREFQCIINDANVAQRFAKTFENVWDALPREDKDRQKIIEFLQSLKPLAAEVL